MVKKNAFENYFISVTPLTQILLNRIQCQILIGQHYTTWKNIELFVPVLRVGEKNRTSDSFASTDLINPISTTFAAKHNG